MASRAKPLSIPADFTDFAPAETTPAPPPAIPQDPPEALPALTHAALADFRPVQRATTRHDGWTAARQRTFLTVLAETGSISQSCRDAGVSSRSAYKLRQRPDAQSFAAAWDQALRLATLRLTTLAFERAVNGSTRDIWRDGELVGQVRQPSDKLLMFLLHNLLPRTAAAPDSKLDQHDRTIDGIRAGFPAALDRLTDHDMAMVPIEYRDFHPEPPGVAEEDV